MRWLVLLLLLGSCASGLPSTPAPSPDEGGRRQQELDWLVAALERRHPDVYNTTPRAEFTRRVADLRVRLPGATPQEALVGLLEVVALVGDSHTRLPELGALEEWSLPVSFGSWGGAFWVGAVQPDRSDLYARELVSLNGHTPEECLEALGPLVPHENELTLRAGVARLLALPQLLAVVGLADEERGVTLTLRDLQGVESTQRVEAVRREALGGWAAFPPAGWSEPVYRSRMYDRWWWTVLPDEATLYFQYNRCQDDPQAPFLVTAAAILERLDRGDLQRLVVDLRHNGGGDSRVLKPFLLGLSRRPEWRGERLIVLIGHGTYSSGMLNAWNLSSELDAVLMGEPTLQKPNCFGELRPFTLPFSGLEVDCSSKRFRFVPDDPPSLEPDVLVPTTFEDIYRGRDPVLSWVLDGG